MPYVDIQSISNPTTGQPIIASWGDGARDALQYLSGGFPHCSILESTAQSVANATETDLTSNEENSDIGGMHSTSSNTERITVPAGEGGLYRASVVVDFAADADGFRQVQVRLNNTTNYKMMLVQAVTANSGIILSATRSIVLAAGDYLTCRVDHTAGNALLVTLRDFSVEWRATA